MKSIAKSCSRTVRAPARRIRDIALSNELLFRAYLRQKFGVRFPPAEPPKWNFASGALHSASNWQAAADEMRRLGLPRHHDAPKNWDTLTALAQILSETSQDAKVLDAGAELYSALLPSLYAYGYRNLIGNNLVFSRPIYRGPIRYEHGDITQMRFADGYFDAVTCLSVIEHGVDLAAFFAEMNRVLKPDGLLVVSTDYWDAPIDTDGKMAFGAPIHVFSRRELEAAVALAADCGLELLGPLDLACREKTVHWTGYGLDYTFAVMTFRNSRKHVIDQGSNSAGAAKSELTTA